LWVVSRRYLHEIWHGLHKEDLLIEFYRMPERYVKEV